MAQLNYKTLRQEVADEIRRKILKGEFKAGERIKEHEMAQMLGVSRGPVREALRQLEQEGLVRVRAKRWMLGGADKRKGHL